MLGNLVVPGLQYITTKMVRGVVQFIREQALENEMGLQRETLAKFVEHKTEAALIECLLRIGPAARIHFRHHPVLVEFSNLPGIHGVELERLVRFLRNYTALEALCAKSSATTEESVRDQLTGMISRDAELYWWLDGRLLTTSELKQLAQRLAVGEKVLAV